MSDRRFLIDTNVLVSAVLLSSSKPRQVVDRALELGVLILSEVVFSEISEVLSRQKFDRYLSQETRLEFLEDLAASAEFYIPSEIITICRDPKDNKYLELAMAGQAECIITGDQDLLVIGNFRGVKILTVQEFLNKN